MNLEELPMLRQSERGAFKRCNWAWYQEYVLKQRPIIELFKDAADFGTLFHVCMAEYYIPGIVRGPHPRETWERIAADKVVDIKTIGKDDDIAKWEDFFTLGCELADAYVERYKGDPHWDVLDAERRFSVIIPDTRYKPLQSEKGKAGFRPITNLVGTFDLCYRDLNDNTVKMTDHKTAARIEVEHLVLDEQASTYIAVAQTALRHQGLIGPKERVAGMEYNFIKRAALDTRPRDENGMARNLPQKQHLVDALIETGVRGNEEEIALLKLKKDELIDLCEDSGVVAYGEVSADQSSDNFMRYFVPRTPKERQRQIVRISEEAQVMAEIRAGRHPVLKTPTKECRWCKFFDICELDESGGDTEYFRETTMKEYDPYSDHREGADNSKKVTDGSPP